MNAHADYAPIAALDLDPIKVKLMHKESGEGWSLAYADAVEFEYRRFLYLVKKFPHEHAAPLFDVDVFWHYHILDTMKYAADCNTVFGYFLHHFPYVGLRGEEDLAAHHRVGERMRELYEQTYGEAYTRHDEAVQEADGVKRAFSMPACNPDAALAGQIAFSMPAAKVALSMPANKVAFSMPSTVAFSMPTAAPSHPNAAGEKADFSAAAMTTGAHFFLERPTLTRAVS
jgi:hypothetical protein